MKIFVKVNPYAKHNAITFDEIDLLDNRCITISTNQPPADGMANIAVLNLLSEYLKCAKRDLKIISGKKSRVKIIEYAKN